MTLFLYTKQWGRNRGGEESSCYSSIGGIISFMYAGHQNFTTPLILNIAACFLIFMYVIDDPWFIFGHPRVNIGKSPSTLNHP